MSTHHIPKEQRPGLTSYGDVQWTNHALTVATDAGLADDAAALARDYLDDTGSYTTSAAYNRDVLIPNRVRIMRDGVVVFVGLPTGVIVHAAADPDDRITTAPVEAGPVGPRQHRPTAAQGPTDFTQLTGWLRDAGFIVHTARGGHVSVRRADGSLVQQLPATPSDWRSLRNAVARLRTTTGLPLRR